MNVRKSKVMGTIMRSSRYVNVGQMDVRLNAWRTVRGSGVSLVRGVASGS